MDSPSSSFLLYLLSLMFWTILSSPFQLRKYLKLASSPRSGISRPQPSNSAFSATSVSATNRKLCNLNVDAVEISVLFLRWILSA